MSRIVCSRVLSVHVEGTALQIEFDGGTVVLENLECIGAVYEATVRVALLKAMAEPVEKDEPD